MGRLEEIESFLKVVDAGSISGAAEHLGVAKSAVSRRLAELEERLGVQLINRTTRRLRLTDSGREYHRRCAVLLADLAETELSVSSEHAGMRGSIRIAAPLYFTNKRLAPILNRFLQHHPEISLDMVLDDSSTDVVAEGFDMAIRIGTLADSTLVARRLLPVRLHYCASPDYLQRHGIPTRPEDLQDHVGLSYSNIPEGQLWQFRQTDGGHISVRIPSRMRSNNGELLLQAAIAGLGIVPSPDFLAEEALAAGHLCEILPDYPNQEIAAYAIYPAQRHLPRRVRALIDHLIEGLRQ